MIYRILKPIIKMSLKIFFRRIIILGKTNVPKKGPAIFVANHPSALIDPLMAASSIDRQVHFLAGREWFGNGFKAKFFKNQLNMIPVYRPWLANGEKGSNVDMFEACYEALTNGECIILFPEASTETVMKIRELKTGAVRIKHGFEQNREGQEVPVIPIGLSYSNAHCFQSKVVVKVGEPVQFTKKENIEGKQLFREHTTELKNALKRTIVHIDNTANEDLVDNVSRLYMDTHQDREELVSLKGEDHFDYNQTVATAIDHFEQERPEEYKKLSERVRVYFDSLHQLHVSDDFVGQTERSEISLFHKFLLVIGFPLALLSLIVFVIPFQLTKSIFLNKFEPRLSKNKEPGTMDTSFTGTLIFGIGTIIFLLWNLAFAIKSFAIWGWIIGSIVLVGMYPLLRFGLYYAKHRTRLIRFRKTSRFHKKHEEAFDLLEKERLSLVKELSRLHEEFDQALS